MPRRQQQQQTTRTGQVEAAGSCGSCSCLPRNTLMVWYPATTPNLTLRCLRSEGWGGCRGHSQHQVSHHSAALAALCSWGSEEWEPGASHILVDTPTHCFSTHRIPCSIQQVRLARSARWVLLPYQPLQILSFQQLPQKRIFFFPSWRGDPVPSVSFW